MPLQVDCYFNAFDNSFFGVSADPGSGRSDESSRFCSQCSTAVTPSSDIQFFDEQLFHDENGKLVCSNCHAFNASLLRQLETPKWEKEDGHSVQNNNQSNVANGRSSSHSSSASSSHSSSSKNAKRRKRAPDGATSPLLSAPDTPAASPRPKKKKVQKELTHEELMAALAGSGDNPSCALEKFTVSQIQDMLRKHKASTKGSKPQLIERLVHYTSLWEQQQSREDAKRPTPPPATSQAPSPSAPGNMGVNVVGMTMPVHSQASMPVAPPSSQATPPAQPLQQQPTMPAPAAMPATMQSQQGVPHGPAMQAPLQPMQAPMPPMPQPMPQSLPQQPIQQHMPHHPGPSPSAPPSSAHTHPQHLTSYQSPDHHLIWQQQLIQQHLYQQQFYHPHVVQVQMPQNE
eukprot:CAMPEP_0177688042 /NCGR_PEP_ID=MMETSP0447-20121125/34452_1 /TAXON_ID=0 /ORGANISM="Stygamoeba regulata, Strain BSH-02190019" /LENGTH=400 /DNA_ID=CAMNT_0019198327 /DNA_START=273 /DNA_END=1475 /DNA_ORIENTATION=+